MATGVLRLSALSPGEITESEIELRPLAWTAAAGARLRIDVSASRFPMFDRNPQSGRDGTVEAVRAYRVATIEVLAVSMKLAG